MGEQVEIAVVGAGPAGLNAALAAAQAGAQVALIDGNRQPGGQYFRQPSPEFGVRNLSPHQREGRELWHQVAQAGVQLICNTTVWGAFEENTLALHNVDGYRYLQARAIILANGAHDRPVAFPGWTLPGVMTAGAVQTLLKDQHILPGKDILLAGTGPLQLVLAAELVRAGARVVAVLEASPMAQRGWRQLGALWGQWERLGEGLNSWLTLARHGVSYHTGWGIVQADGQDQLEQVTISRLDGNWRPISGTERKIACDTVCLGYGFIPFNALSRLLGAEQAWHPELGGEIPVRDEQMQTSIPGVYAVGDGAGIGGARLAAIEGRIAGIAAAAQNGHGAASEQAIRQLQPALARERRFQQMYASLFTPGPGLDELSRDDTILCRCEEITQAEVRQAIACGAESANEVKAVTRTGMGNCQGRLCSHLIARLIARETGRPVSDVGLYRPRPPLFPVPIPTLSQPEVSR